MGILLGIKNQKGKVSVENFKNSVRLRWSYKKIRMINFGFYKLNHKDENLPKRLKQDFLDHQVYTVREKLCNGINA